MASIEKFPGVGMATLEAEVTEVSRVGALTAEAVMQDYESAAKEIEAKARSFSSG